MIPVRFFCSLDNNKDKKLEVLLLREDSSNKAIWQALAKPMKKFKTGLEFLLAENISAKVVGRTEDQSRLLLELSSSIDLLEAIKNNGSIPIPPYIRGGKSDVEDKKVYQTEYAQHEGSVAAPTAGLHFSKTVFDDLKTQGIRKSFVTLHVNQWSFSQVIKDFKVTEEAYSISEDTWKDIIETKENGGRVVAVGTTTVRALESFFLLKQKQFNTFIDSNLFIKPGFEFGVVDSLLTNFHQPNTTHLSLISALFGKENIKQIYTHALDSDYRFLSYGDACFLDKNCHL